MFIDIYPASVLFDGVKTSIKVFKMSIASDYTELTPTLLAMNGKNALLNTIITYDGVVLYTLQKLVGRFAEYSYKSMCWHLKF